MKTSAAIAKVITVTVLCGAATAFGAGPAPTPAPTPVTAATTAKGTAATAKGTAKAKVTEKNITGEDITLTLKVPAFSPRFSQTPVALVNDDPILLDEFTTTLAAMHEDGAGVGKKAGKKDFEQVLNRLVNAHLIVQEGFAMGLDDLPETKKLVADFSESSLREVLKRRQVKDLKPDPDTVNKIYQQQVQEWKIRSVKFGHKEDADAFAKELAGGGKFATLADKLIDGGKAEGGKTGAFVKPKDLLPQIAAALAPLKAGQTTAVLAIGPAFTVVEREDTRYPEGNSAAMDEAKGRASEIKTAYVLNAYWESLKKKYATINKKLIDKIDFEAAKPGFKKLLKDNRVVASIKGEKPVTVGQLAQEMQSKFFHGVDEAIKMKKVNEGKYPTLEDILMKKILRMEALRLGIDNSDEYRQANRKYKDSLVFGLFIKKAVVPDIKVTNGEIEDYYNAHIADYSTPAMVKIKALAFGKQNQAEAAIEKLRKGAEYQWLQANAEGLVAGDKPGLLDFGANLLISKNLPEQLQRAIDGAKKGDLRLYASPEGYYYAVQIQDFVPAKPAPLKDERKTIAQKLFGEKVGTSLEGWGTKLRAASTVNIYLTDQGK
ncbi:MAG: peptidyl-prolyl cis-trans isomerase [Desulfuromonadaceae bacterium]|nr:peptidyl-prolyl cis-trans isomerase [Desulfuromonadaceae bacterium]